MKKITSVVLAAILVMTAALALTSCGSEPKTLEEYLAGNASAAQEIEDSLAGLENDDMGLNVTYDQNKVIITCELKTTYEDDVLDTIKGVYSESMDDALASSMNQAVADIEKETGIEGVSIDVIVNNGDGAEIWKGTYPKDADTPAEDTGSEEGSE